MRRTKGSTPLRNILNEKMLLRMSDLLLGKSTWKQLNFLMESQFWSTGELENYQNEKLRNLIKHSYENVPYYNELFKSLKLTPDDIKSRNDLYKIPVLTKEVFRRNFPGRITAGNINQSEIMLSSSSGSTGEPLQFYETKASHSMWQAAGIRGWYWMGYRLGDRYIKISQNPRNRFIKRAQDVLNRSLYLSSQPLTSDNFKFLIDKINSYKPSVIRFYPDLGLFLSSYIKNNNIKVYSPSAITTTGNILFESTRASIREAFNCEVFDSYSSEGSAAAAECSTHNCYHTSMEYSITEILNGDKEAGPAENGRVITTDLHNFAAPFIRYDTQDYVTKSEKACTCGRSLTALNKIDGRDSDILITPDGKLLIVHNFTVYFEWLDSVEQFQIHQHALNEFDFLLKVNSNYSLETERTIYGYWKEFLGGNINLKIYVVDDIPLAKSGKRRFLIRDNNIKITI